jgi:hypothetical protein
MRMTRRAEHPHRLASEWQDGSGAYRHVTHLLVADLFAEQCSNGRSSFAYEVRYGGLTG